MDTISTEEVSMDSAENSDSYLDGDTSYTEDDEDSEFYFESDHLALRGNSDYRSVLRTIVILEAQRIEAAKHIDRIAEVHKLALNDPEVFIQKLVTKQRLELPGPINVQSLPKINFDKYNVTIPIESPPSKIEEPKSRIDNDVSVRGRAFDQTKPETFNQLWTCEEQQRLEELLVEFPPEPIEMRRFTKIANALGNRTPRQVASRLQKYFQKLYAAGLPVPGRKPRHPKAYASSRKNRLVNQLIRPTTFFPMNYVPVAMDEEDDGSFNSLDPSFYRNGCEESFTNDDDFDFGNGMVAVDEPNDIDVEMSDAERAKELITRIKRDKEKEYPPEMASSEHIGYRCDYCDEDPICGTRWHCMSCADDSIDFCSDCLVSQLQNVSSHPLSHTFVAFRVTTDMQTQSYEDDGDDEDEGDSNGEADDEIEDINSQETVCNGYDDETINESWSNATDAD